MSGELTWSNAMSSIRTAVHATTPERAHQGGYYFVSVTTTHPAVLAVIGAATAVALYVVPITLLPAWWGAWVRVIAPLAGTSAIAGVVWGLARHWGSYRAAPSVDPRGYAEITTRLCALEARQRSLASKPEPECQTARAEAEQHCAAIRTALGANDARWVLGTGYVEMWDHLHALEEALIVLESNEEVIGDALVDEMRLKGSTIASSDDLLYKLRTAVGILGGSRFLTPPPADPAAERSAPVAPANRPEPSEPTLATRMQARLVIRDVRSAVNRFRNDGLDGIVRTRNRLIWTGMFAAFAAYSMLAFAILAGAMPKHIVAAATFFLVGAVIGLFNQLRGDVGANAPPEGDFGLTRARLVHTPILSGIAAVGGVFVTAALFGALNGPILTYDEPPSPAAPAATPEVSLLRAATPAADGAAAGAKARTFPALRTIFDLDAGRHGLLIAAVFGLAPGLLVDRLLGKAEQLKADLRSTSTHARA